MIARLIRKLRIWNRRRYVARIMKAGGGIIKGREAMVERVLFGDTIAFEDKRA